MALPTPWSLRFWPPKLGGCVCGVWSHEVGDPPLRQPQGASQCAEAALAEGADSLSSWCCPPSQRRSDSGGLREDQASAALKPLSRR